MHEQNETLGAAVKDTLTQPLHMPFSHKADRAQGHAVNATRIVEAVLIAAITTLGTYMFSIPKIEQNLDNQSKQIQELKEEIRSIKRDFYLPYNQRQRENG